LILVCIYFQEENDKKLMGVNSPLKFEDHDHIGEERNVPVEYLDENHVVQQEGK
jgi:hypothetical protein